MLALSFAVTYHQSALCWPTTLMQTPAPTMVLLADDDPEFGAALRQAVDQALPGARLIEVPDDATLRSAALAHPEADLVLLNLLLPGSRGFATLAWLRSQFAGMAVLIFSASENPEVVQRAMTFGATGFAPKSASVEQFVEAIRAVLDRGRRFPAETATAGG